jgi:PAS domain S-box-containing protein
MSVMASNESSDKQGAAPDSPAAQPGGQSDGLFEQALGQARANLLRYQELFDFAPDGYLVTDLKAVIQVANHAAAAMLGTRRELLVDRPLYFFVAKDDRRLFVARLTQLTQPSQERLHWEMTLSPPGAAPLYALVTAASVPTEGGWPASIRWTLRDVSERRQAEEILRAEKQLSDSLIEMADAAILVVDADRRIFQVNRYLCTVSGYRRHELQGRRVDDLLSPPNPSPNPSPNGGPLRAEGVYVLRTRDGRTRTMVVSQRSLVGSADPRAAYLVVGTDITDLQEAQRQALQSERLAVIGQTVTTLAHEGRNVLQRALGCLARLGWRLEGKGEELELIERTRKALDDLRLLFDDLRSYAAPIQLDVRVCDLAQAWREAWSQAVGQPPERDAQLEEEVHGVDVRCEADPFRLRQVFANLFANALDACRDLVRVTVSCVEATLGGRPALRIAVRDNGPGFSPEQRQRALEPFFTTKAKGTGLGLAIARRNVEAHGGRIDIEEGGEGGRVILELPRKQDGATSA